MTDLRLTGQAIEVLREGDPDLRLTGQTVEVLRNGDPDLRFTGQTVEVLRLISAETPDGARRPSVWVVT